METLNIDYQILASIIYSIKEYSDCEVTFARLTCNTENL